MGILTMFRRSRIKEDLRNRTNAAKEREGHIEKLAKSVFDDIIAASQAAADKGEHRFCQPFAFPGCRGGNERFISKVRQKLYDMLVVEGLAPNFYAANGVSDERVEIFW